MKREDTTSGLMEEYSEGEFSNVHQQLRRDSERSRKRREGLELDCFSVESSSLPDRGHWDSPWEFLMSCISMSVGLGNVWRFPFCAYQNGGGAFFIPYLITLFFIGRPIYFLELCFGQFTSYSQVKVWKCVPAFKGVGYGSMIATMAILSYYVSIMSLTVYYFLASFRSTLPWAQCDPAWADGGTCNSTNGSTTSNTEMYFKNEVLHEIPNINDGVGTPDWKLCCCLLFCWIALFLSLIRGVKSSGKVAYFTAIFPYIVMILLLVRGVTLPGAWEGVKYLLEPKWESLLNPGVWFAAVTQCFYSLNVGSGSIIMFSSYNQFKHNIYRDAWIISFTDTFTSILAGVTVFAILGSLAVETGVDVSQVAKEGPGLAFISYPQAIAKLDWCPQLFAVLFFFMMFTLAIGSSISDAGAVITIFCDKFPSVKRWKITGVVCVLGCAVGIVYCTPGGQFIVELVDLFGAAYVIFITSLLEIIGIAWIYGMYNFIQDIEFMLGSDTRKVRIGWYWKLCWGFVIPVGLSVILVYQLGTQTALKYNNEEYPTIALVCGWLITAVALGAIPIGWMQAMHLTHKATLKDKFVASLKPSERWGPRNKEDRAQWIAYKAEQSNVTVLNDIKATWNSFWSSK